MKRIDEKNTIAAIELGGTQHIVSVGDVIEVNRLDGRVGDKVEIDKVYLVQDDTNTQIGAPTLSFSVTGEIVDHHKGEKIEVMKYKAKSRYRKHTGHRQDLTNLKIVSIGKATAKAKTAVKEAKTAAKEAKTSPKPSKTAKKD